MRKLLMLCFVAVLAHALSAQTPTRSGAQSAATSKPTSSQPVKTRSTLTPTSSSAEKPAAQPAATPRSSNTAASSRSESANTPAPPTTSGSTTRTAGSRSTTVKPAALNNPGIAKTTAAPSAPAATAKTVPVQMPAAPHLQQEVRQAKVQWLTLEEALEKSKTEKRKIFIDVFTDWCGWCKRMDESTFVDPAVADYLNNNYYPVKFNAEQQQDIVFNNKTYHFRKNGARGYHELAAEWLNNRLSFPTVVFLDESQSLIQSIPTYLEAPKLETILNYFGTNSHKTTPWETYEKKFNSTNQQR